MSKCDNKSVGVIIRNGENLLLIKRKNFPVSYAFVAGHLDGDSPEDAAKKEAQEEAGITVSGLKKVLEETFQNPCKREGGSYHEWHVFDVLNWSGEPKAASDAKEVFWATRQELNDLAQKTIDILKKAEIPLENLSEATHFVTQNKEWSENPGLEPVWIIMLKKIGIL